MRDTNHHSSRTRSIHCGARPGLLLAAVLGLLASLPTSLQAVYQIGQLVEPFEVADFFDQEDGVYHRDDFTNKILVLDFFRVTCPNCVEAIPQAKEELDDYYHALGGNPDGIPVVVLPVNIIPNFQQETFDMLEEAGVEMAAYDPLKDMYADFAVGAIPLYVVINGVDGSPSHTQWEVLSKNNYRINNLRAAIDSVQAPPDAAPIILSDLELKTSVGMPVSYYLQTAFKPDTWTITGLPAGLAWDETTWTITGAAEAMGEYAVNLSVSNAHGSDSQTLMLTVTAPVPELLSDAVINGKAGDPLEYSIEATHAPTSYSATGLPPGLALDTVSGVISGTPQDGGEYTVDLTMTNDVGSTEAELLFSIRHTRPSITSERQQEAYLQQPFTYTITAENTPDTFGATGLPTGLDIDGATGVISGEPLVKGTFYISLQAFNEGGVGNAVLTLRIVDAPFEAQLALSADAQEIDHESGYLFFQVDTNVSWSVSSDADWLTLPSATSGDGNGTITAAAAANPDNAPRTGILTVSASEYPDLSATHTVTQAANPEGTDPGDGGGNGNGNGGGDDEPDWAALGWFGGFTAVNLPQLWCDPLGSLYTESADTADVTFFCYAIPDIGWFWTAEEVYPWLWTFSGDGDWLYYYDQNWFYSLSQDQNIWIAE